MADIRQSVGVEGVNNADDVRVVQRLLIQAAELTLDHYLHPGLVDGISGDGTEGAIDRFQRRIGIRQPDGRVDPEGYTWRRLKALAAIGDTDWTFPLAGKPDRPFVGLGAGMRSFGWRRSGGRRAHAGIDLYTSVGTPVRAVAAGTVRRVSYFYLKTDAVEVEHRLGNGEPFVVRYGEVDARVAEGQEVEPGDVVATVAQMYVSGSRPFTIAGEPTAMLHFELYDGTARGSLTDRSTRGAYHMNGRPFKRRRDLVDPSGFVSRVLPA